MPWVRTTPATVSTDPVVTSSAVAPLTVTVAVPERPAALFVSVPPVMLIALEVMEPDRVVLPETETAPAPLSVPEIVPPERVAPVATSTVVPAPTVAPPDCTKLSASTVTVPSVLPPD